MVADIMTKSADPAKTKPQRDRAFYQLPKLPKPELKIGPSVHVEESLQLGPAEEAPGKR